jgi:hypothetical protein
VIVALRTTPPGAIASLGDRELGPTPAEVELTGELAEPGHVLEITFRRPGFRDTTVSGTVEGARLEIETRMTRIPRPSSAGSGGESETESEGADRDIHVEGYRDSPY